MTMTSISGPGNFLVTLEENSGSTGYAWTYEIMDYQNSLDDISLNEEYIAHSDSSEDAGAPNL